MCKNARLNWLVACAGIAGLAAGAAANEPVRPTATRGPSPIVTDSNGFAIGADKVTTTPVLVDDVAALELANKLGLNNLANPGELRGLGTCPPILSDGGNCHVGNVGLGANFSVTTPGGFRVMENVTPIAQNPDRICWTGRYANRVDPAVANEQFQIQIYNALPDGLPDLDSGPIFTRTFQQGGTGGNDLLELNCLDGQSCPGTTDPAAGGNWVYSAQVNGGFPMNSFGCYWIEIACVGSASVGVNWGWTGSTAGSDLTSLQAIDGQYSTFTRVENDRAICISGGVDPFAGNCNVPPPPPICENPDANGLPYTGLTTGIFASVPPSPQVNWPVAGGWNSFQAAENFTFSSPASVSSICFEGFWQGYVLASGQVQVVGVNIPEQPNFVVTYFGNVGTTGVPGAPLPMATFTTGQPGVNLIWDGDGDIRIEHPPVDFAADQCFWVSVGRVHNQPSMTTAIPVFHWYLTNGTQAHADDRFGIRTAAGVGGAWQPISQAFAGSIENCNMNYLLDAGPVVARACAAPPCNIPAGGVAEGEANCGGGVEGGDTINGGCNSASPVFSTIACGQTRRGTVAFNGDIRDTDWYQFTLPSTQTVTITVNSEFAGLFGFAGDAVGPLPAPLDCEAAEFLNPAAESGGCAPAVLTRTLPAGTWTVIVLPIFGDQIACAGTTGNEYTLNLACGTPEPCNIAAGGTPEGEANCGMPDDTVNGGCNSTTPVFSTIACGQTIRGTGAFTAGDRDTDWYQFTLAQPSTVTVTVNAEFAALFGFIGNELGEPIPAGTICSDPDNIFVFGDVGGNCTPLSIEADLPAGTWTVFVGADFDGDIVNCSGTAGNEYTILVECEGGSGGDCNGNGIDDAVEIAGNPALDCYNPTAMANPNVTGGPDGALDACQCMGNFNRDGSVNSSDISALLTGWLAAVNANNTNADIDCSGSTNSSDISAFLTIWLAQVQNQVPFDGCP